jgi:hypothetical protein
MHKSKIPIKLGEIDIWGKVGRGERGGVGVKMLRCSVAPSLPIHHFKPLTDSRIAGIEPDKLHMYMENFDRKHSMQRTYTGRN